MTRIKVILTALAIFGLVFATGCDKEDGKAEGDKTAAKATGDMSKEELAEKAVAMFKVMAKAANDNKGNCDGMATAMEKILNENESLVEAGKKFDQNPEDKKWFEEKYGEQIKEVMGSMMGPMMECQDNEKLKKVFEKMSR